MVLGAEYAGRILKKPTALHVIRNLGVQAANYYAAADFPDYDDRLLKLDQIVREGDTLDLGGVIVKVLETPGHTKCSLSFLMNNETLFSSESTGCMNQSGQVYSAFVTSYSEAIESIRKCQRINPKFIISPHFGPIQERYMPDYWHKCLVAADESKEFILRLADQGYGKEQILAEYAKHFRDETYQETQPADAAFQLNIQKMITTVLEYRLTSEERSLWFARTAAIVKN
jgi:glyoxylase-like metal-dependent hydrolase (beta-lactamase superfamily II)